MSGGPKPLLTLESYAAPEHYVLFDGQPYYLIGPRDVGFETWARITRIMRQITAVQASVPTVDPGADEAAIDAAEQATVNASIRIDKLLDEILDLIAPSWPAEVRAKLSPGQKLQIAEAFSHAVRPATEPGPGTPPTATEAAPSTGAPSSPGSTGTTARRRATAATGSKSRSK